MSTADVCSLPKNSEPATYAVLWNREMAAESLNERRVELGLSMIELDEAARQAAGTAGKYLGPGHTKGLGLDSIFKMATALGLRLTFEVDPAATAALLDQCRPRHANQARPKNLSQKCGRRTLERALHHMATVLSWPEALAAVGEARRKAAVKEAARAARAAAAEAKRSAVPAAAAFDAPMVTAMSEYDDETPSIAISRAVPLFRSNRRGRLRQAQAVSLASRTKDPHPRRLTRSNRQKSDRPAATHK